MRVTRKLPVRVAVTRTAWVAAADVAVTRARSREWKPVPATVSGFMVTSRNFAVCAVLAEPRPASAAPPSATRSRMVAVRRIRTLCPLLPFFELASDPHSE